MASSKVRLKTVAVGYGCVGKTSMFLTYTTKEFPGEYIPAVFDNYPTEIDDNTQLGLWDTGGERTTQGYVPLAIPRPMLLFYVLMSLGKICMLIWRVTGMLNFDTIALMFP